MLGEHCHRIVAVLQQANVQFHPRVCSRALPRRLVAQTASAAETSTRKPNMATFSAGAVLTAMVLMAKAGTSPTLTIGFSLGRSVMNSAIGGLTL